MKPRMLLLLSVCIGVLFGSRYALCNEADTCLETMRESIGSLKRSVPPGYRRVMKYRTRKVISTPRGVDTLVSTSELTLTSDGLRLVTEGLEVATDSRTTVIVFPERRIISITDADTTKNSIGKRMESMGFLQDSLFNLPHRTICGDTQTAEGQPARYITLEFPDDQTSLFACSDIRVWIDSTGGPGRIAIAYRPGASYVSVEIEFLSSEEGKMEGKEIADVEGRYFLSRREIRPEFREYSVVDKRRRSSTRSR